VFACIPQEGAKTKLYSIKKGAFSRRQKYIKNYKINDRRKQKNYNFAQTKDS
jgi:hypothetical protein